MPSQLQVAAIVAMGIAGGLLVGGDLGYYFGFHQSVGPKANVEFTGTVSIPGAASLRFYHTGSNMTVDTVLPVNSAGKVKAVLVNSFSYNVTAYASNRTTICSSSIYIPSGNASFTAVIVCAK